MFLLNQSADNEERERKVGTKDCYGKLVRSIR